MSKGTVSPPRNRIHKQKQPRDPERLFNRRDLPVENNCMEIQNFRHAVVYITYIKSEIPGAYITGTENCVTLYKV